MNTGIEGDGEGRGEEGYILGHRSRRERTQVASIIHTLTSRIRASGVPGGHPRHDSGGRGK